MASGVYLSLQKQTVSSSASGGISKVVVSNIEDRSVTISWVSDQALAGNVIYGQNLELTARDDRDQTSPVPRHLHYVSLKNLTPQTTYQFRAVAGPNSSSITNFTTASTSD